jgi:alpha-beta hydrolase superfamily lysophospholipase
MTHAALLAQPAPVKQPAVAAAAQSSTEGSRLGLPGETLAIAGRPAFILWPNSEDRLQPQPWILYAPTLPGYPDQHERWMHEQFLAAGVAVAGIDVGEAYGSPEGRAGFDALYAELTTRRGFGARPCLLGRSRGGLWVTSWACDHPDRVAGLAGIYPVFDLRTYPGLDKAAPAYGLTAAQLGDRLKELNPIERVERLAQARLPAFIIHGDIDQVVPLRENSATFLDRYRAAGAEQEVRLRVVEGQGHNFWEGFFRCQELVDFAIARARVGAGQAIGESK